MSLWRLVRDAAQAWSDDYAASMGAALSYYTLFSIAPLLLLVISVAGLVFGPDAARGEVFVRLEGLMGTEMAAAVERLLQHANRPAESALGAALGMAMMIIGATTVLTELQSDLDRIWRVRSPEGARGAVVAFLCKRLISVALVLGFAVLVILSLVVSAAIAALGDTWGADLAASKGTARAVELALSFALLTVVFAMVYKFMPSAAVAWRDVWIGAAVTSALFALGKVAIGLYLGRAGIASAFGAAGSLVAFMVWIYYSAQVFLLGAEFTRLQAERRVVREAD